ncbi:hypothetical protein BH10PSE6_BH10PSE6_05250 [soil metagenome]
MKFDDYEKKSFAIYEAFAETVRVILEKALQADEALPRPQSIQSRAKGVDSLRHRLTEAGKVARVTERAPIETTFGKMEGFKTDAVTRLIVEIVEGLRYVDPIATLQLLIDIYRDEPDEEIRQQIVRAVKNLSEYNIDAFKQVGPTLQLALVDHLARLSDAEVDSIQPIALTIWAEAIQCDITGAKWKADSVVLSTAAVPASGPLSEVRDKALKALFSAYDRSANDEEKRAILLALDVATTTPNQVQYSTFAIQMSRYLISPLAY